MQKVKIPLTEDILKKLKAGNEILLSGIIYTARDAAHRRLMLSLKKPPFNLENVIIYYTGPTPTKPGKIIGSCGPTTAYRMDKYTPKMLEYGVKATIGKGRRSKDVISAMKKYKAVYFATTGGAGALLSKYVKKSEVVAFPDLGCEAIFKLQVEDFPVIVINDIYGNDLYNKTVRSPRSNVRCRKQEARIKTKTSNVRGQ
ncbi:MAG: Fe-S-containing hydro-lyase [Elusimicrobia bacterium]|nr:Fe-S-containing hydro-lyase [Elusimicrobiota bacterium]